MKSILTFVLPGLITCACSINTLVIRQMEPILLKSSEALYEESDLQFAEQALASNLKLIEGLLKNDPANEDLLLLAAQGYAGYALGFAEDEDPQRAKIFYLRARDYALQVMRGNKNFRRAEGKNLEEFKQSIDQMDGEQLPALFWTGFSWAGYANLSLNEPSALADLPKIQIIMDRVETLNPAFFYGAVYLYQGSVYGGKPVLMGGDPQKAKLYFDKNLELTGHKFLLSFIYLAKYYAAKILDENLYDEYLNYIQKTPLEVLPEIKLLNQIAKKKARHLEAIKKDIF